MDRAGKGASADERLGGDAEGRGDHDALRITGAVTHETLRPYPGQHPETRASLVLASRRRRRDSGQAKLPTPTAERTRLWREATRRRNMRTRLMVAMASALVAAPLLLSPAFSMGDGGSSDSDTIPACKKGQVWNKKKHKCVDQRQGMIDDESIYETGRALAKQGRYAEAIEILTLAADKTDPRILNYLGYSHGKQGRVLVGLGYYEEALHNDPDYTLVREYKGEAHLQLGDVAAARVQLDEIRKRRGTTCSESVELSSQVDA